MDFFEVEERHKVVVFYFNRPQKANAMNTAFWKEVRVLLEEYEQRTDVAVIVWAAKGKNFCAGLDWIDFFHHHSSTFFSGQPSVIEAFISELQEPFLQITRSDKVHIAAVQGACVGSGLDFITACDLRFASQDAFFSLRETRLAIVADLGSLNRLPQLIGYNHTQWMAYTGKDFPAEKVYSWGLLSEVFENQDVLLKEVLEIAQQIAQHSATVLKGIKKVLNFQWNQTPYEGMRYVAKWNGEHLLHPEFIEKIQNFVQKG